MRKSFITSIVISIFGLMLYACQDKEQMKLQTYMANGKEIYKTACQGCHGANGEGLKMLVPPLTDVNYMTSNKATIACMIKNGMNEAIIINRKEYSEKMPAFPEFTPIDIAQVMVYITNSFGNQQGNYSYQQVAIDLKNCKEVPK